MKSAITILFSLILCTLCSAQTVLKYSDHESDNEMRTLFLRKIFFPAIEKESNGRIKIDAHWNGELSISYDALNKVAKGDTIDVTTVVPEYAAKELPISQLFKSFLVGPNGKKQVAAFRKMYETIPELNLELDQNNVVPIFLSTGYGVGFFSREKVDSLSDIKNKTWRTASFWHRDYLKNYGAIPVTIPWGEQVYDAFRNKSLDGLMVNIDGGYQLKVYEHAPYILASKNLWLGHLYVVAINKQKWNDLEPQDKEAIQRAARKSYQKLGKITDRSFIEQLEKLKKVGAHYRILTKSELASFEQHTHYKAVQENWIKEQELKGVKNLRDVLGKMTLILKKK